MSNTACLTSAFPKESVSPVFLFRPKDPISALTHFLGAAAAVFATPVLLIRSAQAGADLMDMVCLSVFMLSMILLYCASTAYHSFHISQKVDLLLKKMDHLSIFLLIAGSYTPVCRIVLTPGPGMKMLALVWGVAAAGMIFKLFWVTCPKWVSSVIYIAMGWLCTLALPQLVADLSASNFLWLLAGGLFYTVGGVIYALRIPVFHGRIPGFGAHELFHLFVLAGSFCHFMVMMRLPF